MFDFFGLQPLKFLLFEIDIKKHSMLTFHVHQLEGSEISGRNLKQSHVAEGSGNGRGIRSNKSGKGTLES